MDLRKGLTLIFAAAMAVAAAGSLSYQYAIWWEYGYWPDLSIRMTAPLLASTWYSRGVLSNLWSELLDWQIWQALAAAGLLALYGSTHME